MKKSFLIFLIATSFFYQLSESQEKREKRFLNLPSIFNNRDTKLDIKFSKNVKSISNYSNSEISSTVVFEEDFESPTGFPPPGWKTVNNDGGGTTGPWFAGNTSVFTALTGNSYAAANYQGATDFLIDEWLISPLIFSITEQDTLLFWHRSPDYSPWNDSIQVLISTSDTELSSFSILIDYFKTSTAGWVQNRYHLTDFIPPGSNIYIAFRYLIYDGGVSGLNSDYVGIDLVQIVRPQVNNDLQVLKIEYPENGSKIIINQKIEPTVTFRNAGKLSQSSIPVSLKIISPEGSIYENNRIINFLAGGESINITFDEYTPVSTGYYSLRSYTYLDTDQNHMNDSLISTIRSVVTLSGSFTVGIGGNIPSLKRAIDTLNNNIISDDVTLTLIDFIYNEPPLSLGPLDYLSTPKKILFKPATGVSPIITINSTVEEQYGFSLKGASYVSFDGSNSTKKTRNTTITATGEYAKIGIVIQGTDKSFADSNKIMNIKIRNGADSLVDAEGYFGVLLLGFSPDLKDFGNTIFNCDITNHGAVGIGIQWQEGSIVENNFIHDWNQITGENDVHGVLIADGNTKTVVRNNKIGNIRISDNDAWAVGIENSAGTASSTAVYNNFIYNILSSGSGSGINRSIGIYGSSYFNSNDLYCYNSIYLSGTDYSTSDFSRTAGIELSGGDKITILNNIIYNESIMSGGGVENKTYGIYLVTLPTDFISNNNIFYLPSITGVTGYNNGVRQSLSDWRTSFIPAQDDASIFADPQFVSRSTGNLHINQAELSPANAAAVPVVGITKDIDENPRNTLSPDIGADEFIPGGIIVQTSYTSGWNLVSLPLTVESYYTATLFPGSISDAFSYQGSYVAEQILTNGPGYWLKFDLPISIEFIGLPRSSDTVSVFRGWNLIGCVAESISVSSIIEVPTGIVISNYYSYDDIYRTTDFLVPGRGYWVKVSQDGELILR